MATRGAEHGPKIFSFVSDFWQRNRRSPTYREIGAALGLRSTDHVYRDVRALINCGHLRLVRVTQNQKRRILLIPFDAPTILAEPPPPTPPPLEPDGHCKRCSICCDGLYCEECANGAPLIQTHLFMGQERYRQQHAPIATLD